jgi:integrase/recombinase XerC
LNETRAASSAKPLPSCCELGIGLAGVTAADASGYLEWQARPRGGGLGSVVVHLADRRGAAPATMNRRIAAARGLFEFMVMTGLRRPARSRRRGGRRGCAPRRGCWAMYGPAASVQAVA